MATIDLEKIPLTTLRLMIPATWDAHLDSCEWSILDRQSKVLTRGKDLISALPQCDEVEVVVPASMVGFIPAQLPPGSQSKILGALAFLVEAGLISTPEDTHAVLAEQSASQIVVAVIQKSWMKRLLEKLSRVDIFPARMFPETLLPELPQNGWAMVCRGHESFIRTSVAQGMPVDVDTNSGSAPLLLVLALQQCEPLKKPAIIAFYGELVSHSENWQAQLGILLILGSKQEWFVSQGKPALNLLQGDFQPSGGVARRLVAFKPVAIGLAALVTLQFSLILLDYAIKASENRKLDQAMLTQFKATFPDAKTVVDAPLQMQRNLEELKHGAGQSGHSDYLPLLSSVTNSIGSISGERLRGIAYQNNQLLLNLSLPDMQQAEAIQKRLSASGLSAAIEAPRKTEQGLELQLTITASDS